MQIAVLEDADVSEAQMFVCESDHWIEATDLWHPAEQDPPIGPDRDDSEANDLEAGEESLEILPHVSLALAARQALAAGKPRRSELRAIALSLAGSILLHGGLAAAFFFLMVRMHLWLPRFSQGAGSSESGLLSDRQTIGDAESRPLPGSVAPLPHPAITSAQQHLTAPSDGADPPQTDEHRTRADWSPAVDRDDPVIFGLAAQPSNSPQWNHSSAAKKPASPAAPPAGGGANVAAANASAAPARHVRVPPIGLGKGGMGAGKEGGGFDSRGLPKPIYPHESIRRREAGTVEFDVLVNSDGSIGSIKMFKDSGYPRLNQSALDALHQARFSPATEDGKPIAVWIRIPFQFIHD